ncbi:zinc finger protein 142 isoform X2 [Dendropsophus ebraccatus]|uniref:zinc finger protein 142 isoform X2 n=1 Tax=Dendropsophus ebraccatus TaxID=150705 RepID=UPI0038311C77
MPIGSVLCPGDLQNPLTHQVSRQDPKSPAAKKDALTCPLCPCDFKTPSELKEHFRGHPPPPPDLRCWQSGCSFVALDLKRFQSHVRREHKLSPVSCSHRSCRLLFPSSEEMSLHLRSHYPFHCNLCDYVGSNSKIFSQHKRSQHSPEEPERRPPADPHPPGGHTDGHKPPSDLPGHDYVSALRSGKNRKMSLREESERPQSNEKTDSTDKRRATKLQVTGTPKDAELPGDDGQEQYKTHMCPECKRCFKKRTHLADHLHLHFPDPDLQCPNCRKFFTSRNKLKIHMMREAGEKAHACPLCDYSAVEKNALNRHMASIHEGVSNFYSDTYSCPMCQETFNLSQALKDHMKGHKMEQRMRCLQQGCDHVLSDRKDLLRHLKESHRIQAVECRYHACSLLFMSRQEMEVHRKNHYAFHCQDCDFVCSNKHVFRKHKKCGHPGKEELACRFCPYKSFNPVEYADHEGKMHANEKIHRCQDCDFATAHKRVLMRHSLLHTGEKPHKCSQCDFMCRDISYLSKHMLTHSTEKNYMCTECGYITKWKHYLTVHMRKHSGDLRYHCSQCSYRCHRADQLSSHKLRHQGKTLICEICGFGCKRKTELQKHMQVKHCQCPPTTMCQHCQCPPTTMYQCQHCSFQTKYKQTLRNHENGKHTRQREFGCALCSFRTFSNTSLFFHKRKSHGYIPGDQDWLERYASKKKESSSVELLFPYRVEATASVRPLSSYIQAVGSDPAEVEAAGKHHTSQYEQVSGLTKPPGGDGSSVADETLLAAITLEPAETCSIEMEDFPVRLELSQSSDLLAKEPPVETLVACGDPLPIQSEILCFPESMAVEEHVNCGQDHEEEADPHLGDDQEKGENGGHVTAQDNQDPILSEMNEKGDDLHVNTNLDLQSGDLPIEVQESWTNVVKGGAQLTIVCESSDIHESNIQEVEATTIAPDEADGESCRPEAILKALRKQDKEQAEMLVLEGRVQMLMVQSSAQVYRCEKCSYITKKKGSIVQHAKTGCHLSRSSLVCKECGSSFKQQRGLNTHILKKCPMRLKKRRACLQSAMSVKAAGGHKDRYIADSPVADGPVEDRLITDGPVEDRLITDGPVDVGLVEDRLIAVGPVEDRLIAVGPVEDRLITDGPVEDRLIADGPVEDRLIADGPVDVGPVEDRLIAVGPVEDRLIADGPVEDRLIADGPVDVGPVEDRLIAVGPVEDRLITDGPVEDRLIADGPVDVGPVEDRLITDGPVEDRLIVGSMKECIDLNEHLFPCQSLLNPQKTSASAPPSSTGEGRMSINEKYRIQGGKFHCLLCSFSCSRECTITCHVTQNCQELQRVPCTSEPLFEVTFRKLQEKHNGLENTQELGTLPGCSVGEDSQNPKQEVEENVGIGKTLCNSNSGHRLSCSSCAFTCTQERAMRTHRKKGCLRPGELQCPFCSFRCMSPGALTHHRELHQKYSQGKVELQCKQCNFTCKQPRCMKQHVRIRHEGVKPHCCQYCDFSTTRRYRLEAHESLHTGVGRITCNSCSRTFGTNSKLRLHQRRIHEKTPTHFCQLCDYSGYSQNDVARHMGSCHSGEAVYPCAVCQASFSSEAALKQHSLRKHQEKAVHQCPQCSFSCHSQATLRCHMQKQHRHLQCTVCKETFSRREDMEDHRKTHFSHHCQQCQYAAKDRQQLINHYAEEHESSALPGGEADGGHLRCPFCSFSCHHQLVYDHHVKGHGATRIYKCSDCEYSTRNKQKITWHSRIHTGEKPYKCHLCSYTCADPSRLKYHMRIHKDEKNYLCPECGYKCKWVNQLKYHMTKHTGLKPYQCEECDYCTNRADALRVHRETRHRDVRSFICEQCGKAFKTRFLLKTHLKKHSEEKPYICNVCQRGFRWPAGLRHHYLTHTNQQPFFCHYCSYRAKQKFQVVKHLQRHHPNNPDLMKGIGKEPYLLTVPGQGAPYRQTPECGGESQQ